MASFRCELTSATSQSPTLIRWDRETSMMEDCATGMSASQGGIDNKVVVEEFKEALTQRIGEDRFRMWFDEDVSVEYQPHDSSDQLDSAVTEGRLVVLVRGQFAVDRLRKNFIREMRAAASQVCRCSVDVSVQLAANPATQTELPLGEICEDVNPRRGAAGKEQQPLSVAAGLESAGTKSITSLVAHRKSKRNRNAIKSAAQDQPFLPNLVAGQPEGESERRDQASSAPLANASLPTTLETLVTGSCNQLAYTAAMMACETPGVASPLFVSGPTGVGKTHLLAAIADQFRRRHRYRRVIHLSAESFTNDFINSVASSGLPAFRRRYRDVDALLIDDVQFLGSKRATLREMQYTVETLCESGRPMVFSGSHAPTEIPGLSQELSGRLASGLVCPMQPLCGSIRETLLRRSIEHCCLFTWPEDIIAQVNTMLIGDGRVIQGVVHLVATLQRMYQRMPTMDEIHHHGGQLLRASKPAVTLSVIEQAVAQTFQLPAETLRSQAKTRTASEPRMLAMYLSRELTSAAYSEIGRFYGGRSHSTAIVASQKVKDWLKNEKTVGRGAAAVSAREAIRRIESIVRGA